MNNDELDPQNDMDATMERVRSERAEDLAAADAVPTANADLRASFLAQMKASVPSHPPDEMQVGAANSNARSWAVQNWAPLSAAAALAAAILVMMALRVADVPAGLGPNSGGSSPESHDQRGPLMGGSSTDSTRKVTLESADAGAIVVRLGAGFLESGFYRASAYDGAGDLVATLSDESSDRWLIEIPASADGVPVELTIDVEMFFEGASLPEESWSSTLTIESRPPEKR